MKKKLNKKLFKKIKYSIKDKEKILINLIVWITNLLNLSLFLKKNKPPQKNTCLGGI